MILSNGKKFQNAVCWNKFCILSVGSFSTFSFIGTHFTFLSFGTSAFFSTGINSTILYVGISSK